MNQHHETKPTGAGKSSFGLIDTAKFFRELDLKEGVTFLDVACGWGHYALAASEIVGKKEFQEKADIAQRRSIVLLKNKNNILPLKKGGKIYIENIDARVASQFSYISTSNLAEADIAILRVRVQGQRSAFSSSPEPISLTIPEEQLTKIRSILKVKPTIIAMYFVTSSSTNSYYRV